MAPFSSLFDKAVLPRRREPRTSGDISARPGLPPTRENKQRKQPAPNGFTLVEMMVVIFIIGLLTAVVAYNVFRSQDTAMVTKARSDIARLGQALEMYRLDNMRYPSGAEGLQALVTPGGAQGGPAGYIQRLPDDPWGNPYQYSNPGRSGPYDIYSLGADGTPGGEGENADIFADDS